MCEQMLSQRREIHERQRPCESLARSQTLRGRDPNWEGCPIEAGNPRLSYPFLAPSPLSLLLLRSYLHTNNSPQTFYNSTTRANHLESSASNISASEPPPPERVVGKNPRPYRRCGPSDTVRCCLHPLVYGHAFR